MFCRRETTKVKYFHLINKSITKKYKWRDNNEGLYGSTYI